eukprot:8968080-Pyramimonas_sp.AAC.1
MCSLLRSLPPSSRPRAYPPVDASISGTGGSVLVSCSGLRAGAVGFACAGSVYNRRWGPLSTCTHLCAARTGLHSQNCLLEFPF